MILSALIALLVIIVSINTHITTEKRIRTAIHDAFPNANIFVDDRVDFDPGHQICVALTIKPLDGSDKHAIIMIGGDSDGGTWPIASRKFGSMQECTGYFNRG